MASEPREASRCPARQPERLQSKCVTPDGIERVQVHRERRRFKPATLEAVFSVERPVTLHAAKNIQTARDVRRVSKRRASAGVVFFPRSGQTSFSAPIFFPFAEWGRTGARRRGLCSRARKIRTHCAIIKWPARGLAGSPVPGPPVAFSSGQFYVAQCDSYLSEQIRLNFRAVGRIPAQDVTARPWPNPRSTSSLARDSYSTV